MIPSGDKILKIQGFMYIDHCAEGISWTIPAEGEVFLGIPAGWYKVGEPSFIEVRRKVDSGPEVVRTINPRDVSEIVFNY